MKISRQQFKAYVSVQFSGGTSLPIFGWSLLHGDLRVAHFLATHSMQVIPLLAVAAAIMVGKSRVWPAFAIAFGYTLLVGIAFYQALAGSPFLEISRY